MRINLTKHVLWAICSLSFIVQPVSAHELDDGFIERAVQVRIRDDKLNIEYAIGLTEPTMQQIMVAEQVESSSAPAAVEPEPLQFEPREEFKAFLARSIIKSLGLTIDGKSQQLVVESITDYPRHHYDFVVNLTCKLTVDGQADLQLKDANYTKWDGAVRYALKSSGATMVTRSDVSPIIVRAKRHQLRTLKPDERHNACQICATIACIRPEPKD